MAESLSIALILEAKDKASEFIDRVRENVDKLAEQASEASKRVATGADQMTVALEKTDEASTRTTDAMERQKVASTEAAAATRDQVKATDEATVATDKQTESTKVLGTTSEESAGKMDLLSKANKMVGLAMLGVAAVSVKLAIDFQESVATLAGQAGITTAAANNIGNAFLKAGGQTTFTSQQMMSAFAPVAGEFVNMYGKALDAAKSLDVMNAAMMLAEAGGGDLNTTTKALADVMMVFHLKVSQAADAANIMFNTSRLLGVSSDALGQSFTRLEPKIAGSGMSLKQTAGFIDELSKSAGGGKTAIRAVGSIIQALVAPSTSAQTKLGELGVSLDNSKGKFIGMTAAIGKIHDALMKLPGTTKDVVAMQKMYKLQTQEITLAQEPQTKAIKSQVSTLSTQISALNKSSQSLSQSTVMQTLFGKSAALVTSIVAGGVPAFTKSESAITKQGAAAKAAAEKQTTFAGEMAKLKSAAESIFIELGQKLLPVLTKLATKTVDVVNGIINWVQHNETLSKVILGAVIAATAFVKIAQIAKAVTEAWASAQVLLNAAMDANPLGMIVIAIAAVVTEAILLIKYWRDIYNAGYATRVALENEWNDFASWFVDNVIHPIVSYYVTMWNQMVSAAVDAWHGVVTAWDAAASWFNDYVIQPVVGFFEVLWDGLTSAASATWHAVLSVWDPVASWFNEHVIQPVVGFFEVLWDGLTSGASTAWHGIVAVWDAVASWFNTNVIQPIENFFEGLWDKITGGVDAVVNHIKSAFSGMGNILNTLTGGIAGDIGSLFSHLASGGLVTSPTLAVVGEAGPELVVPLSKLPGGMGLIGGGGVAPLPVHSMPSSPSTGGGTTIQVNVTLAGQVYGSLDQLANELGRRLATVIVPGAGTRLVTR